MKTVIVIFGCISPEHTVSIRSAATIISGLDSTDRYEVIPVYIAQDGVWYVIDQRSVIEQAAKDFTVISEPEKNGVIVDLRLDGSRQLVARHSKKVTEVDVAFPITHGVHGEDGVLQGALTLAKLPFVGPGVAGSALAMDKALAKSVLRDAGVTVSEGMVIESHDERPDYDAAAKKLASKKLFIKPVRNGSSVGVRGVETPDDFDEALEEAFSHDSKVLIEEAISGIELECSVIGYKGMVETGEVGAVLPPSNESDGYSFDEKYGGNSTTNLQIPAQIGPDITELVKEASIRVVELLECEEMARVDFFYSDDGRLILNEVNTLPGFTSISMYPKLFTESGVELRDLLVRLVEAARPH